MSHSPETPSQATAPEKLSTQLHKLSEGFKDRTVTIGEVLDTLGERAASLLMLVCAMPFMVPVSLPGLSTLLGAVILALSFTFLIGGAPWLPKKIRSKDLPPKFFAKVLEAGSKFIAWIERHLKERQTWICASRLSHRIHAIVMILATLMLMLPLPPFPPLTNTLPALVVVIIVMSLIARDGLGVIAGYFVFLFTIGYFVFWGAVVIEVFKRALEYAQKYLAA